MSMKQSFQSRTSWNSQTTGSITDKMDACHHGLRHPSNKIHKWKHWFFVVVDGLSKMIRIIPMKPNQDTPKVAKLYKDFVYRPHGLPMNITSDRDPMFMSKFWKALFETLGTRLSPSSAYHPQTDGQIEIMNWKIEEMIRCFVNYDKSNWDENLVDFEGAYTSSVQATTSFTLFYLNYGIEPKTVLIQTLHSDSPAASKFIEYIQRAIKVAQAEIRRTNETTAKYVNRKRYSKIYSVGDLVWLSTRNISLEDGPDQENFTQSTVVHSKFQKSSMR